MAVTARYTEPMQWVDTPEQRARVKAIADREKVSQASVIRDALAAGLPVVEGDAVLSWGGPGVD